MRLYVFRSRIFGLGNNADIQVSSLWVIILQTKYFFGKMFCDLKMWKWNITTWTQKCSDHVFTACRQMIRMSEYDNVSEI